MKYIINQSGIILFLNNKTCKVTKQDSLYPLVIKQFDLPEDQRENAITKILFGKPEDKSSEKGFVFQGDEVFYKGEKLPLALSQKVIRFKKESLPFDYFEAFWENLKQNPSSQSIKELYDFLEYKELPITEDGCFLAYKGVQTNMYSVRGNKETKVIRGVVDENGKILNSVGEIISVERNNVDDDRNVHCSFGLHVGSLDYARGFAPVVVVVKVNPKDVVSVPTDYSCQKCRVSSYEVVSIFEQEIVHAVVDKDIKPIESEIVKEIKQESDEFSLFKERINNYLLKKDQNGESTVSIRKIQNIFSPKHPSKEKIISALNDLGWIWKNTDDGCVVQL